MKASSMCSIYLSTVSALIDSFFTDSKVADSFLGLVSDDILKI
jgi:hypothetical protein